MSKGIPRVHHRHVDSLKAAHHSVTTDGWFHDFQKSIFTAPDRLWHELEAAPGEMIDKFHETLSPFLHQLHTAAESFAFSLAPNSQKPSMASSNVDRRRRIREAELWMLQASLKGTHPDTPCNVFVARALELFYGINDFIGAKGVPIDTKEIPDHLNGWHLIGVATDPHNLKKAQDFANLGRAVIGFFPPGENEDHGHVCLIIPGELNPSDKKHWNAKVPNCANWGLDAARKKKSHVNFVGDLLSRAVRQVDRTRLTLYYR
jgi:hypothetical protein